MEIKNKEEIFYISGRIDDKSNFSQLLNYPDKTIYIDFSDVIFINSIGIKQLSEIQQYRTSA